MSSLVAEIQRPSSITEVVWMLKTVFLQVVRRRPMPPVSRYRGWVLLPVLSTGCVVLFCPLDRAALECRTAGAEVIASPA